MMPNEYVWRDEYLIFPAVKSTVAVLAQVTAGLYIAAALFWSVGLALLCGAPHCWPESFFVIAVLEELATATALPCLYLLALWSHQVLLAGRGMTVTRWVLLSLLFFAFLHPVCVGYALLTGAPLLVNQFLLPAVLYTVLPCIVLFNLFRMAALPLRCRALLLLFSLSLLGQYILQGSFLILLPPCFGWAPLRLLGHYAPRIVSLPPKEADAKPSP